jgi:LAO/AO transport system kinase
MLKAGLMEAGDLFVVNKADRDGATQLQQQLQAMLALTERTRRELRGSESVQEKPLSVFSCSAINHQGVREIADAIESLMATNANHWQAARKRQAIDEVRQAVIEAATCRISHALGTAEHAETRLRRVLEGEISIEQFVDLLLNVAADSIGRREQPSDFDRFVPDHAASLKGPPR